MSDPTADLFGPARASMRTRLGEFVDVYMDAKIEIAKKLASLINLESNPEKLMTLRKMLSEVVFAEDDITQLDGKISALLTMLKTNAVTFTALREEWMTSMRGKH